MQQTPALPQTKLRPTTVSVALLKPSTRDRPTWSNCKQPARPFTTTKHQPQRRRTSTSKTTNTTSTQPAAAEPSAAKMTSSPADGGGAVDKIRLRHQLQRRYVLSGRHCNLTSSVPAPDYCTLPPRDGANTRSSSVDLYSDFLARYATRSPWRHAHASTCYIPKHPGSFQDLHLKNPFLTPDSVIMRKRRKTRISA